MYGVKDILSNFLNTENNCISSQGNNYNHVALMKLLVPQLLNLKRYKICHNYGQLYYCCHGTISNDRAYTKHQPSLTADIFANRVNTHLLPNTQLFPGFPQSIRP